MKDTVVNGHISRAKDSSWLPERKTAMRDGAAHPATDFKTTDARGKKMEPTIQPAPLHKKTIVVVTRIILGLSPAWAERIKNVYEYSQSPPIIASNESHK
jgi:hypothetical protein